MAGPGSTAKAGAYRFAAHSWQLRAYLDYWLEHVVKPTRRPATYALYEMTVRLHLAPALGKYPLKRLSVPIVQTFLNGQLRDGQSVRYVHIMRQVLSAALSRAVREELIARNVARLVELPTWQPAEVEPWSSAEALAFLTAAADDPLYPAFVLLLLYGMRRGEVLGLRWQDIDLSRSVLHIRQQIQCVRGSARSGCMPCGTPPRPCSKTSAARPGAAADLLASGGRP